MLTPLLRWLSLKRYQFEVTVPMYMMTPTECFILYSIIFLLLSLILIAAVLYLPEHVAIIASRAMFYWAGEEAVAGVARSSVTTGPGWVKGSTGVTSGLGAVQGTGMGEL